MRVLIVGDEHVMRFLLEYTLRTTTDWTVDVASDCAKALAHREAATPDLILIRMLLPQLQCGGAMSSLSTSEVTRGVPVVVVTGTHDADCHERLVAAGAAGCLTEPYDPGSLAARIRALVDDAAPAEASVP